MSKSKILVAFAALSCLVFNIFTFERSHAKEKKPTVEQVVAKHLASLGNPEVLASIHSRTVYGVVSVRRPAGLLPRVLPEPGKRADSSNFLFASANRKLGMVMKLYDPWYPGEHFAFDEKSASVSFIGENKQSTLGEFISLHSGLMREGLLGGVLSTAWPLANTGERKFKLKYDEVKIEGVKYHEITYTPKSRRYLEKIMVSFLFDFETYRHVVTEYDHVSFDGSRGNAAMTETFGNFKIIDGLTLPFSYSIAFPPGISSYSSYWDVQVRQVKHNGPIDSVLFQAP